MATYPLYLAFADAARRLELIRQHLGLLRPYVNPSCVVAVDVHYRAGADELMLGLKLDVRCVSGSFLDRIRAVVEMASGVFIDLARLDDGKQRQFHEEFLP